MAAKTWLPAPRSIWTVWQRCSAVALCAVLIASAAGTLALAQMPRQTLPPAVWEPAGPVVTWRGISFIVPGGMRGTDERDFYGMAGPGMKGTLGECKILILRDQPAGPNLARQANDVLLRVVADAGGNVIGPRGGPDLTTDLRAGRASDGWLWVELNGMVNNGRARIMLISRGATVLPIVAVAGGGNGCVGLMGETTVNSNTITWLALYYSLRIAGSTPSTHVREQIVGSWNGLAGSQFGGMGASQGETYALDGRYGRMLLVAGGGADYPKNFAVDGSYVVEGHRLTIFPDQGAPQTSLVRIVEEREGTTPPRETRQLCRINVDAGGPFERCLPTGGQ